MNSSPNHHFYNPAEGHGLAHNSFNAIVGPRPIGWISSHDNAGHPNLAPYSYFNAFSATPPILGFSSIGWKDTVRNIQETGEFVWNLVTRPLAEAMNITCSRVPSDVNEFALAGLTEAPCQYVKVPRVAESPVAMECKLLQIVPLHDLKGQSVQAWLTLGQVVGVHIDKTLLKDGIYQTATAHPILRAGGEGGYSEITSESMFEMKRPD